MKVAVSTLGTMQKISKCPGDEDHLCRATERISKFNCFKGNDENALSPCDLCAHHTGESTLKHVQRFLNKHLKHQQWRLEVGTIMVTASCGSGTSFVIEERMNGKTYRDILVKVCCSL